MPKDCLGKEIGIGDEVLADVSIFADTLLLCKVIKFVAGFRGGPVVHMVVSFKDNFHHTKSEELVYQEICILAAKTILV